MKLITLLFGSTFILFSPLTDCLRISRWNGCLPDNTISRIIHGVPVWACMEQCWQARVCLSVDYRRLVHECRLSVHTGTRSDVRDCLGTVLIREGDFPSGITDSALVPVFEMTQEPGCSFVHNVDETSIQISCINSYKNDVYTQQPTGEIANHLTVFRAFTGNGFDPYWSWMYGNNTTPLKTCISPLRCSWNYRHPYVDLWDSLYIQQVKLSVKKYYREVAYILFNCQGCGLENWFDKSRIINSSWTELTPQSTYNYFSLYGHVEPGRRFFISSFYGGCEADRLYLMTSQPGMPGTECPWDNLTSPPQFSYSAKIGHDAGEDLELADTLEIALYF